MPHKYRLRMSGLRWFLIIYDAAGNWIEDRGPYSSHEMAQQAADASGLHDWDKDEG